MAAERTRRRHDDDGSAVVEFALVSIVLVMLLLAVLQVAIYLHIRNVVAASAAEGARYAANADVPTSDGGPRASAVIARAVGAGTARRVRCQGDREVGAGDAVLVAVRCHGALPVFFAPVGRWLPLDVSARALEEGP